MIRIPLLKDRHNHLFSYGSLATATDLFKVRTEDEAIKQLSKLPHDRINVAMGWFDSYFTFSKENLEKLPPIIICNNSLHNYIFNSEAGKIVEEQYNEWFVNSSNQTWIERNTMQVLTFIAKIYGFNRETFDKSIRKNLSLGVCFAADMYVCNNDIFEFLATNDCHDVTEVWTSPQNYPLLPERYKNVCRGIKLFADGACGASTAAISEYRNGGNPFMTYTDSELTELLEQIVLMQCAMAIHCIGENAIEQVLKCLETVLRHSPDRFIRLEHTQFITESQAKKARDLNLTLSMQPNFNMDSIDYSDRLTKPYCERNDPFRMLIDKAGFKPGENLVLGSDGMPTGVFGSLPASLFPPAPGQRLSLDEYVAGYCTDNFDKGHIEVEIDNANQKVDIKVVVEE
ncbi:MAG: amidohydrolase family protein [Bacteroidales bacterium]|nr:amidohydrolase family protein [Bacteroidales bacterium]